MNTSNNTVVNANNDSISNIVLTTILSMPGPQEFKGSLTTIISYENSLEGVDVDLNNGIGGHGNAEGDTYINVTRVLGSNYDDIMIGNQYFTEFNGKKGDDAFFVKGGKNICKRLNKGI